MILNKDSFLDEWVASITPVVMNIRHYWFSRGKVVQLGIKCNRFSWRISYRIKATSFLNTYRPSFEWCIHFRFSGSQTHLISFQIVFRNIIIFINQIVSLVIIIGAVRFRVFYSNQRMSFSRRGHLELRRVV